MLMAKVAMIGLGDPCLVAMGTEEKTEDDVAADPESRQDAPHGEAVLANVSSGDTLARSAGAMRRGENSRRTRPA